MPPYNRISIDRAEILAETGLSEQRPVELIKRRSRPRRKGNVFRREISGVGRRGALRIYYNQGYRVARRRSGCAPKRSKRAWDVEQNSANSKRAERIQVRSSRDSKRAKRTR